MTDVPRAFPLPERKRAGYPWIEDPEHPLWEAQQAGWPDHAPHEAMAAAVKHDKETRGRADSRSHPAFDPGYISNPQATREAEAPPPAPVSQQGKARR